jgi:glyoxylase-like metal-dependent hydrolase (beta-lactamase superfamily II)
MEITPGVHQVDGVNGNCYVLVQDHLVLIDTGLPRSHPKILTYIQSVLKRDPKDIKTIILTHHHVDHSGSLSELRKVSGAQVAVHVGDKEYLNGKKPLPEAGGVMGLLLKFLYTFYPFTPVEPDIILKENDIIAGMLCVHTPGHTPGSICLVDPEHRVVFVGDTLIMKGATIHGPPPGVTMNMPQALESVKKIALLDFDIMLCGHGEPLRPDASNKVAAFCKSLK